MKNKKECVMYCEDGIVVKGENGNTYFSWEYEMMDLYGKDNASKVVKHLLDILTHDNEIGFDITFTRTEKTMKEIL